MLDSEGRAVWHRLHRGYDDSMDPFVQLIYERETSLVVRDTKTHYDEKHEEDTTYDNKHEGTTLVIDKRLIHAFVPRPSTYDANLSNK